MIEGIARSTRPLMVTAATCLTLLVSSAALAQSLCVYDPFGQTGNYVSLYKDYQLAAMRWGTHLELKAYTDDGRLSEDFRAGRCDMASMIGMRAREYNLFTGSIDAPGALENYAAVRELMNLMASPRLAPLMTNGDYEVEGVLPVGAGYAVVNDRKINGLAAAAGKRTAYMAWDQTEVLMANTFHIVPVPSDLLTYGSKFNAGQVDLIVAPMSLYKPMELAKGIGDHGGIVHRPLFQFTVQLVAHRGRFPADFGQQSRTYMNQQVDHALGLIRNDEAQVDSRYWIYALHSDQVSWNVAMRGLIQQLVHQGSFDGRMVRLMQRVRCKTSPDSECGGERYTLNASADQLLAGLEGVLP